MTTLNTKISRKRCRRDTLCCITSVNETLLTDVTQKTIHITGAETLDLLIYNKRDRCGDGALTQTTAKPRRVHVVVQIATFGRNGM